MPNSTQDELKQRLHAIVQGRVQGVGFRATTIREASSLDLTGWVCNRRDGTVEVVAEGTRGRLHSLLLFLKDGPPAANVTGVDVEWGSATQEFDRFRVRY